MKNSPQSVEPNIADLVNGWHNTTLSTTQKQAEPIPSNAIPAKSRYQLMIPGIMSK